MTALGDDTHARQAVPVPAVEQPTWQPLSRHAAVRVTVRGRSLRLRGLQKTPTGALAILLVLGPGLIAATAGDDAGGIATYSQVGAKYGYDLLWVLLVITLSLALIQETCARLGAATGRGLLDLVRERFGIGWALFAVGVVLLANGGVVVTEFVGIAAAAELFGISRYLAVPVTALLIWYLVIQGSYASVEKVFLAMALVFLAYPIAAVLAHPDWGAVARGAFVPTLRTDPNYLILFVGLIGTTITPYMQLFQQSSVVEKGVPRRQYGPERADAYIGSVFSNIIAAHCHRDRRDAARGGRDRYPDRKRCGPGASTTCRRRGTGTICRRTPRRIAASCGGVAVGHRLLCRRGLRISKGCRARLPARPDVRWHFQRPHWAWRRGGAHSQPSNYPTARGHSGAQWDAAAGDPRIPPAADQRPPAGWLAQERADL